jgi:hypothetical protein
VLGVAIHHLANPRAGLWRVLLAAQRAIWIQLGVWGVRADRRNPKHLHRHHQEQARRQALDRPSSKSVVNQLPLGQGRHCAVA